MITQELNSRIVEDSDKVLLMNNNQQQAFDKFSKLKVGNKK